MLPSQNIILFDRFFIFLLGRLMQGLFGTLAKLEVPVCLRAALEGHGCNKKYLKFETLVRTLYSQILARKPTNCEHRVESLKRSVQHCQRGATNGTASSSAIIGADNP